MSPVSNHVYERRLIEKYIAENGTDPVNNQPLSEEQLIDIKGARGVSAGRVGAPRVPCSHPLSCSRSPHPAQAALGHQHPGHPEGSAG